MRFAVIMTLICFAGFGAAQGQGQAPVQADQDHWGICINASHAFTPQRQYHSCSLLLDLPSMTAPMAAFTLYNRANASLAMGNFVDAVEDYDRSIAVDRSEANVFKARCWALSMIGQLDRALADCSYALNVNPGQDDALETRGLIYLRRGDFEHARNDFDKALKINAGLAGSLFGRGIAQIRLGDANAGNADIMAARVLRRDIDAQYARFGLKP